MPRPCKLTFDLLTLKVVSESRLVFIGLSVLDLGPMYATDRRQTPMVAGITMVSTGIILPMNISLNPLELVSI